MKRNTEQVRSSKQTERHWEILLFSVLVLIFSPTPSSAESSGPPKPPSAGYVDMHCHIAGIGAGKSGCFISAGLQKNWRFKQYLRAFGITRRELEEKGDGLAADRISASLAQSKYVSKAVVLALDGVVCKDGKLDPSRTQIYVPNEFVADAVGRHKNLLFGASVNPYRSDALERLEWAEAHGAVLVKWIPSIMNIDPADPKLIPFYRKLIELDLPLLSHAGKEFSFPAVNDELCDPDKLQLPLKLGVKVIVAHIASTGTYGGERSTDRLIRLMRVYQNVYADISALTQLNRIFSMREALTRPEFKERLLYGTDYPIINTALVSPWYYGLRLSPKKTIAIYKTKNPWDADVLLKRELGTPADIFERSSRVLLRNNS